MSNTVWSTYVQSTFALDLTNEKGIDAEIINEHFLDGKNKHIECITSDHIKMQLLVPSHIKENVRFLPTNPLFVPVQ